ncbi:hypothetical protein VTN02DRAFT_3145 [Thermoascus thermophilus]
MGTETSFKAFPAHVHGLLANALAESHVVYSKIYPRYKSRRAMEFARDDFSKWISPCESENTDVVLLGHSLGGILAADVALLPSESGSSEIFKHRILGVVNFDVPFLGLHPGVISTGLGSLFRPKAKPPSPAETSDVSPTDGMEFLSSTLISDPTFNPDFPNDVRLPKRSQLDSTFHFITKHSSRLARATAEYVSSHVEFGSCLVDYPDLKSRYRRIRELEDVDEYSRKRDAYGRPLRRIRFVNYYTASTGYIKPSSPDGCTQDGQSVPEEASAPPESKEQPCISDTVLDPKTSGEPSPQIPVDGPGEEDMIESHNQSAMEPEKLSGNGPPKAPGGSIEPPRNDCMPEDTRSKLLDSISISLAESLPQLPPLPDLPDEPSQFDPSQFPDKDTLKLAQKEHARQVKAYGRAKKDREKAIRDRLKLMAKREQAAAKQLQQKSPVIKEEEAKSSVTVEEVSVKEPVTPIPPPPPPLPPRNHSSTATLDQKQTSDQDLAPGSQTANPPQASEPPNPPNKERNFYALPRDASGTPDPLWVKVYMEGIDEVVAHQSLFIPNSTYEKLVGDTAHRIAEWVQEDQTRRMILAEAEIGGLNYLPGLGCC